MQVYLLGGKDPSERLNITSQKKNIQYIKASTTQVHGYIDLRYRSRCNRHNTTEGARQNVPSRETGNIWYTKEKNNTNTYVLDTTICTQMLNIKLYIY
jgi:hypothetical protein